MFALSPHLSAAAGVAVHTVRVLQIGAGAAVTAFCARCGSRVLPPFPIRHVDPDVALEQAQLIAADASRRCGTPEAAPACQKRGEPAGAL